MPPLESINHAPVLRRQLVRKLALRTVFGDDDLNALRPVSVSQIDGAAVAQRASRGERPLPKVRASAGPAMRRVERREDVRIACQSVPIASGLGGGTVAENSLHGICKHAQRCPCVVNGAYDAVLVGTRVLVLIADQDWVPARHGAGNHRMSLQQRGNL